MNKEVRVRFAPSPTGVLHLGGARTALFNYLYARHCGGKFLLRIEDTDRERSTDESTQAILEAMKWMGMEHDEEIVYQSKRIDAHKEALDLLISKNAVYKCYCTAQEREEVRARAQEEGTSLIHRCSCREGEKEPQEAFVWRFKMPREGETVFDDLVQGTIVTKNEEIEDLVIARSDNSPLYNFVVVVDDAFMAVSHVIRGKDHLTNTPKQINIYKALGLEVPQFAHLPLILGLSKRLRSAGVESYRDQGYLMEGLINYISRLGWSYGDQEIFDYEEIIEKFELSKVNRSEGSLDMAKMEWVNQQHIQKMPSKLLAKRIMPFIKACNIEVAPDDSRLIPAIETMKARSKNLVEMAESLKFYFIPDNHLSYDHEAAAKFLTPQSCSTLHSLAEKLSALCAFEEEKISNCVKAFMEANALKLKDIAQPARVAMVGKSAGPGLYETMLVLGQESTVQRLRQVKPV